LEYAACQPRLAALLPFLGGQFLFSIGIHYETAAIDDLP